jgi:hypothetical protein
MVLDAARHFPALVLTGPRRSVKTTKLWLVEAKAGKRSGLTWRRR